MGMRDTKEGYNEYMRIYMAARYYKRRAHYISALGGECAKCGSLDPLEFDHIDREDKEYEIGKILATGSKKKVEAEMAKCQLLCTPCHKEKSRLEISAVQTARQKVLHGSVV